jgi:hypothetical protein
MVKCERKNFLMKEIKYIILCLVPVPEPQLITVPVPTFYQVTVPITVPVPLVKKLRFLRFRFRFRFHNTGIIREYLTGMFPTWSLDVGLTIFFMFNFFKSSVANLKDTKMLNFFPKKDSKPPSNEQQPVGEVKYILISCFY